MKSDNNWQVTIAHCTSSADSRHFVTIASALLSTVLWSRVTNIGMLLERIKLRTSSAEVDRKLGLKNTSGGMAISQEKALDLHGLSRTLEHSLRRKAENLQILSKTRVSLRDFFSMVAIC